MLIKTLADIICVFIYYRVLPYLLNYAPGSINTEFQLSINPTYYYVYYFGLFAIGVAIDVFLAYRALRPLKRLEDDLSLKDKLKIRQVCYTFPRRNLLNTTFKLPLFAVIGSFALTGVSWDLTVKIEMLIIAFLGIPNLIVYFLANNIMKNILISTFDEEIYLHERVRKTRIYGKLLTEIFSTIIISFVTIFMFVICNMNNVMGDYNYDIAMNKLTNLVENIEKDNVYEENIEQYLYEKLKNEEWFAKINNEDYIGNSKISEFMDNYIKYYAESNGGRTYDYYGQSRQASVKFLKIRNSEVLVGILYDAMPSYLFKNILLVIAGFLIINIIIIYSSSKSITSELNEIEKRLSKISKNDKIQLDLLPIISTNEIGSLTKEFNEVQNNINKLNEVMNIQTKFATIGEMATLMAHDINNPASSLDTSIELLKHFKVEDERQEQYDKLVENMRISNNKILKVVNDTQNQFRNVSKTDKTEFKLSDLLNSLCKNEENELQKIAGKINLEIKDDVILYGVESRLYQVIMNIVRNAILTYKEKNITGNVDILVYKEDDFIVIAIKDTAGGIPKEIQKSLFKKILTTRGKKGTGLGLYLSAGIVKGDFGGQLSFKTEDGVGTTFYIKIPKIGK